MTADDLWRRSSAGIVPSNTTTYTLSQITNALYSQTGAVPYLGCFGSSGTILDEVWYFHHVLGTVRRVDRDRAAISLILT